MKNIEFTISVKRPFQGARPDIVSLISDVPDVVVLGGESDYAVDIVVPIEREAQVRSLVEATCDIEESQEFSFLGGIRSR